MWKMLLIDNLFMGSYTDSPPAPSKAAHRRLGRSLAIQAVDTDSCNDCDFEIYALSNNIYYDVERCGIRFVALPQRADTLLVTGPVTHNIREALICTLGRAHP